MKQEYHRALEQICLSEEARARIISVLEQKERGLKRPRRRIGRLILVCAVLILLLLGTGAAVVSRVGVLELFFQGDTSQLEPFVQTGASEQDQTAASVTVIPCMWSSPWRGCMSRRWKI